MMPELWGYLILAAVVLFLLWGYGISLKATEEETKRRTTASQMEHRTQTTCLEGGEEKMEEVKTKITPELINKVTEELKKAQKGEGLLAFLKQGATDESGNASSPRIYMYASLLVKVLSFGSGLYFAFTGKDTMAYALFGLAGICGGIGAAANASAQKKSAAVLAAKNKKEEPKKENKPS